MFQNTNDMKLTELLCALRLQAPYSSHNTQQEQEIEGILCDLAQLHNFRRLKSEFLEVYDNAGARMRNELGFAYKQWRFKRDAKAALIHLENVADICNERLSPAYYVQYTEAVSYFRRLGVV